MRILIGTLFITLSAVFSDCIVPDYLAPILQRHRRLIPTSHGIHYTGELARGLEDITQFFFNEHKVSVNGFIIGLEFEGILYPIYDADKVQVIVNQNGMGNTPLRPDESCTIPYCDYNRLDKPKMKKAEFYRRARKEIRKIMRHKHMSKNMSN